MTDDHQEFLCTVSAEIDAQGSDEVLGQTTAAWFEAATAARYSYHFSAFGRPIIQYPQDMIAVQELIWQIQPDVIIETGIARGGSLVMSAGMLAVLDHCDAVKAGDPLDPRKSQRRVIGIDIDIRAHNRVAIENHPLAHYTTMIEGSSVNSRHRWPCLGSCRPVAARSGPARFEPHARACPRRIACLRTDGDTG